MRHLIKTKKQAVSIALYSAEQVIDIFEKKHPSDKRLREVIEAVKAYLKNPCSKTKKAAAAAADAAAGKALQLKIAEYAIKALGL